jgi:photosystem II stability/assembly factor-like uncharacterized protein
LIDERFIFDQFHAALDVPVPSGAFDRLRAALVQAEAMPRRRLWLTPRLRRAALLALAILVLLALAVALLGVLVAGHRPTAPPHGGPVTIPTRMVSATTGWAEVNLSEIWRTGDAGASWTEVDPPSLPDQRSQFWGPSEDAAFFLDAGHAWVVETGMSGPGASGLHVSVFGTADGGRHWKQGQSIPLDSPAGMNPVLYFIDARQGWLLMSDTNQDDIEGSPILYATSDGGLTWRLISTRSAPVHSWCGPVSMTFVTVDLGWLVPGCGESNPFLLVTRDGGVTWHAQRPQPTARPDGAFDAPIFFSPIAGMVMFHALPDILLVTSDGGLNWSPRSLPESNPMWVSFADAMHGWAVGTSVKVLPDSVNPRADAPLYHTDDGGLSWAVVPTDLRQRTQGYLLGSIDFVDQKNGFASASDRSGPKSLWLKTSDGGRTWSVVRTT